MSFLATYEVKDEFKMLRCIQQNWKQIKLNETH